MGPLFPDKVCLCQAARTGDEEGPGFPDPRLYPKPRPEGSLELGQELQGSSAACCVATAGHVSR